MKITTYVTLLFSACLVAFAACQSTESGATLSHGGVELRVVSDACRSFALKNSSQFPSTLEMLVEKDSTGAAYIEGADAPLLDVWGNRYEYEVSRGGKSCHVRSLGSDGLPGGEGDSKDIEKKLVLSQR